jgi:hypothetical protein
MIKKILVGERVRKICGSFAFIEHRFLRDGFFTDLNHLELLFYFFLVLVSDRCGVSYYSFDKICGFLGVDIDAYIEARNALIDKDLIAFDGTIFQVLSLPDKPRLNNPVILKAQEDMERSDPATMRQILRNAFGNNHDR